jgi:hypothetical protein
MDDLDEVFLGRSAASSTGTPLVQALMPTPGVEPQEHPADLVRPQQIEPLPQIGAVVPDRTRQRTAQGVFSS